jgi:hypothetical protein
MRAFSATYKKDIKEQVNFSSVANTGDCETMAEGKLSAFYVIATVLVLLSMSMFVNGSVSADSFDNARQSASSMLADVLLHGDTHKATGTLYDIFCYGHNEYFGLRF